MVEKGSLSVILVRSLDLASFYQFTCSSRSIVNQFNCVFLSLAHLWSIFRLPDCYSNDLTQFCITWQTLVYFLKPVAGLPFNPLLSKNQCVFWRKKVFMVINGNMLFDLGSIIFGIYCIRNSFKAGAVDLVETSISIEMLIKDWNYTAAHEKKKTIWVEWRKRERWGGVEKRGGNLSQDQGSEKSIRTTHGHMIFWALVPLEHRPRTLICVTFYFCHVKKKKIFRFSFK